MKRHALNKYNAPEVLSVLVKALEAAGLDDTVKQLKNKGFFRLVNDAWMHREKQSSAVWIAARWAGQKAKMAALGMSLGARFKPKKIVPSDKVEGAYLVTGTIRAGTVGHFHKREESREVRNILILKGHTRPPQPEVWSGDWKKIGGPIWATILEYSLRFAFDDDGMFAGK